MVGGSTANAVAGPGRIETQGRDDQEALRFGWLGLDGGFQHMHEHQFLGVEGMTKGPVSGAGHRHDDHRTLGGWASAKIRANGATARKWHYLRRKVE